MNNPTVVAVVVVAALSAVCTAHVCIHDEVTKGSTITPVKQAKMHTKQTYESLRISYSADTATGCQTSSGSVTVQRCSSSETVSCTSDDVMTTAKETVALAELDAAVAELQSMLSVERLASLVLSDSGDQCCGFYYGTATAPPNTDLHLFVTFDPVSSSSTLAWAGSCQQDQDSSRPIVGRVNIVPSHIGAAFDSGRVRVMMHEMLHVLAFTSNLMYPTGMLEYFTKADGQSNVRVASSSVVAAARTHYACDTAAGVELAYYQLDESAVPTPRPGGHWEKEHLGPEIMTAVVEGSSPLSSMTLGLLQDTGWYQVDMAAADHLDYGYGEGCTFLEDRCDTRDDRYFCTAVATGCTYNREAIGQCKLFDYSSNLPSYFQYFSGFPARGGYEYYNFCPRVSGYSNAYCTDTDNSYFGTSSSNHQIFSVYFGSDSLCYESSVLVSGYSSSATHRCHRTECINNNAQVRVYLGDSLTYPIDCPVAGGSVDVSTVHSEYSGTLVCPPLTDVCQQATTQTPSSSRPPSTTPTASLSQSPSSSRPPSTTPTASLSQSPSSSRPPSTTPTASLSQSPSSSRPPSTTPTASLSQSPSPSPTPSPDECGRKIPLRWLNDVSVNPDTITAATCLV